MSQSTSEIIRDKSGVSGIDTYLSEPCIDMHDSVVKFWKDNNCRYLIQQ